MPELSTLIIAQENRTSEGLRVVLRSMPEIGDIHYTHSNDEALVIVSDHQPSVVIIDVNAVQHSLSEFIAKLRDSAPGVFCIALINRMWEQELTRQADAVLLRGFSTKELMGTVTRLSGE